MKVVIGFLILTTLGSTLIIVNRLLTVSPNLIECLTMSEYTKYDNILGVIYLGVNKGLYVSDLILYLPLGRTDLMIRLTFHLEVKIE